MNVELVGHWILGAGMTCSAALHRDGHRNELHLLLNYGNYSEYHECDARTGEVTAYDCWKVRNRRDDAQALPSNVKLLAQCAPYVKLHWSQCELFAPVVPTIDTLLQQYVR